MQSRHSLQGASPAWRSIPGSTASANKRTCRLLLLLSLLLMACSLCGGTDLLCSGTPAKAVVDWAQFRFVFCHTGFNPYEFVLSPDTVVHLGLHWRYTAGAGVDSSPAVANGRVYVGSFDSYLYALNASTGALLWRYTTGNAISSSSPTVAKGVVYVGCDDGNLYALTASTGALLWRYTTGSSVWSSPAVVNEMVYFGSNDGNLYALEASTGALIWKYTIGSRVASSPGWPMVWSTSGLMTGLCTR